MGALQKQNEVLQAEADAKKQVAEAQGIADANVVQAKGDSEANRLRQMSLTPGLIRGEGHREVEWAAASRCSQDLKAFSVFLPLESKNTSHCGGLFGQGNAPMP